MGCDHSYRQIYEKPALRLPYLKTRLSPRSTRGFDVPEAPGREEIAKAHIGPYLWHRRGRNSVGQGKYCTGSDPGRPRSYANAHRSFLQRPPRLETQQPR